MVRGDTRADVDQEIESLWRTGMLRLEQGHERRGSDPQWDAAERRKLEPPSLPRYRTSVHFVRQPHPGFAASRADILCTKVPPGQFRITRAPHDVR
jgi:hypothetical protein